MNPNDVEYDFTQTINTSQLLDEISTAGLASPSYVLTEGTTVQIFYQRALSDDDVSVLNDAVSNHIANPVYVTLALQAQIAMLMSYLNNANPAIANTARAVIVGNLAPKLPPALLTAINAQIATLLGG